MLLKSSNTYVCLLEGLFASFFFLLQKYLQSSFLSSVGLVEMFLDDSQILRTEGAVMFQLI